MKNKHSVRIYSLSGKFINGEEFDTSKKAYEEYKATIENLKEHLPHGRGVYVVRFDDDNYIMAMEMVMGTK